MPSKTTRRRPPTEGAYTLHDLYGAIKMGELKGMVEYKGKPTKDLLVKELVRTTPLDQLGMSHIREICRAFSVPVAGRKEDCLRRLGKLLIQDGQTAAVTAAGLEAAGYTAETTMNLISREPTQAQPIAVQVNGDGDEVVNTKDAISLGMHYHVYEERLMHQQNQESYVVADNSRDKVENIDQKGKQNGNVAGMKTKQALETAEARAGAKTYANDYSIKTCIDVLNTMEELSSEEKAESFDLFKDEQNREIFICAEPIARILWLHQLLIEMISGLDAYEFLGI
ncbi:hypothetical protein ACP70R_025545 [Stipagrostis hirtigluma subsp. patula]